MRFTLILLSLMLAAATAQPTTSPTQAALNLAAPAKPVSVTWNTEDHNFGQIPQGKPATFRFEFTNTGSAAVRLKDVKPACSCTAPSWSKDEVAPGATGYVEATFNAAAVGVFHKNVTVFFEGEGVAPVSLRFKGEVQSSAPAAEPQHHPGDGHNH